MAEPDNSMTSLLSRFGVDSDVLPGPSVSSLADRCLTNAVPSRQDLALLTRRTDGTNVIIRQFVRRALLPPIHRAVALLVSAVLCSRCPSQVARIHAQRIVAWPVGGIKAIAINPRRKLQREAVRVVSGALVDQSAVPHRGSGVGPLNALVGLNREQTIKVIRPLPSRRDRSVQFPSVPTPSVRAAHRPPLCRSSATVDRAVARVGHISLLGGWSSPRLFAQCGAFLQP